MPTCEGDKRILELWVDLTDRIVAEGFKNFCFGKIEDSIVFFFKTDKLFEFGCPQTGVLAILSVPLKSSPGISDFEQSFSLMLVRFQHRIRMIIRNSFYFLISY